MCNPQCIYHRFLLVRWLSGGRGGETAVDESPTERVGEADRPAQDGGAGLPVRAPEQPQLRRGQQPRRADVPATVPAQNDHHRPAIHGHAQ